MSAAIQPFSDTTQQRLREEYNGFCALCLEEAQGHAAHWFDRSSLGDEQVTWASDLHLISQDFSHRAQLNGIWRGYSLPAICLSKLASELTSLQSAPPAMTGPRYPHAIFCPAEPVLDYLIESYTNSSMNGHIISVDDVCTFSLHILRHTRQLLANLRANPNINPEAAAFIGLYRLLPTRPPNLATSYLYHFVKSTPSFPLQRIRMGTTFVLPSANQATDPLVPKYRIYDALGTPPQVRVYAPEIIPLYNTNLPQFNEQHWRLGRSEGLILAFFHVHVSPTLDFQRQSPIHAKLCRLLHFMEERLAPSTQSSFRISNTSQTAVPLAPAIDLESLYENPRTPQSGRDDFNTFSLLNESSVSPGAIPSPVIRSPTPLLTHSSHPGQEDLTQARLSEIEIIEKNEIVER